MKKILRIVAVLLAAGSAGAQDKSAPSAPPARAEAPSSAFSAIRTPDLLEAQVLLDRARFSPGMIDGVAGTNVAHAVRAFRRAHGLPASDGVDEQLIAKLRDLTPGPTLVRHRVTDEDLARPYIDAVPKNFVDQSKLERVGFTSAAEALAERFHMSEELLRALNPGVQLGTAGLEILVVAVRRGKIEGEIARIEIDKTLSVVRAYDADRKLLASYPATIGSTEMPSPNGTMQVEAVATDAAYYFDPDKLGFGPEEKLTIAAGPNNPVGGVWIDLSEEGYGIHGTPNPKLIRKTASHGCVRLTNWDARDLAEAVKPGVLIAFVG